MAGKNKANGFGVNLLDFEEEVRSVHAGHAHVGNDDMERHFGHEFEGVTTVVDKAHLPFIAKRAKHALQRLQNKGFIIDKKNAFFVGIAHAACAVSLSGKRIIKV